MEATDELKDYLYRKSCDDCFKKINYYKVYKILLLLHSLFKCYIFISYFLGRKKITGI